jgi:mannose-6-phosphate isomerase-like protein (cupin superfamily)
VSVIQERVPAGEAEVMHYHERSRQFFYILEGEGRMFLEGRTGILEKGKGIEIEPMVKHQFRNDSQSDVHFLVISVPSTRGDRINSAPAAA